MKSEQGAGKMIEGAELYQQMGERIRRRRLELGLTQVQVAMRLGIPQTSYSDLEVGRKRTRLDRVVELSGILKISPAWLAFGIGSEL